MIFAHGEEVTVLQRTVTGQDRYGKDVFDWPEPGVVICGCGFDPGTSTELNQPFRQSVNTQPTIYDTSPCPVDIRAVDKVVVRDREYQIDGSPTDWTNPFTGTRFGRVIKLKVVEG